MILACPSCGASFRIDADKLGARGRTVRCSKCKHTWHATPDDDRTEDTAASEQAADRQPEAPNPAPDGGPAPIGGEGPEPGDERVLRTHAAYDDGRADSGAEASFDSTLRASRYRPYEDPPEPVSQGQGGRGGLLLGWLLLALVVVGVIAGGWAFREQVVAQVPQAAQIYRLAGVEVPALGAGLELRDVTRTRRLVDGRSLLVIEGRVVNTTDRAKQLPPMEVVLFDAAGDEVARWRVRADVDRLEGRESTPFETRREDPPQTAREFALSFTAPERAVD
ncbi:DUF3426 domain-containing protein [Rhodovibrio salinarum]|nr:DUF3426 domain-containing protein [Rhodovibrio salinarum]